MQDGTTHRNRAEAIELDYVVAQLRALPPARGAERSFAIGKLILAQLFDGDPQAWHDRRRNKRQSLRRLAMHKNCPFSKSTLSQAVCAYVTMLELTPSRRFKHVSVSHLALIFRFPAQQRLAMVERIEREQRSVRDMREEVSPARRG